MSITATLDSFNIEIKGSIAAPSAQEIASGFRRGAPGYASLVDVNGADEITLIRQLAANVSSLKTQGIDIDLRWRENIGGGRVDVSLQGTSVQVGESNFCNSLFAMACRMMVNHCCQFDRNLTCEGL